jgi:hypothetical protein
MPWAAGEVVVGAAVAVETTSALDDDAELVVLGAAAFGDEFTLVPHAAATNEKPARTQRRRDRRRGVTAFTGPILPEHGRRWVIGNDIVPRK